MLQSLSLDVNLSQFESFLHFVCIFMHAMSAEPLDIYLFTRVCVSAWSVIGPLAFSNIHKILNNVALHVLISVIAS